MKDEHLQKYKKIIGKSNGKDYIIELEDGSINFTIIDKVSYKERYYLLNADQLAKMQILSNELKKPDHLMSYFAAIKQQGKYEFIEILPNQNILINIQSRKMQKFSVALQTKARQKLNKNAVDSQVLNHMIQLVVQEKINIFKKQLSTKLSGQIKDTTQATAKQIKSSSSHTLSIFRIILILGFIYISSILIIRQSYQQESQQLRKQNFNLQQKINHITFQIQQLLKKDQYFGEFIAKIGNLQQKFKLITQDVNDFKQFEKTLKMKIRAMDQQVSQITTLINSLQGDNVGGRKNYRYGRHA